MATVNVNAYDPIFYAQEGMAILKKALGMAGRVYRGYDRDPQTKGSTIQIRAPQSFVAQDAPGTDMDLQPSYIQMVLNKWKEVKIPLSDKDITLSDERLISDHIGPMAYALADAVDIELAKLCDGIPWYVDASSPVVQSDISAVYQRLFDNKVPMTEGLLHFMVGGTIQKELQDLQMFHSAQVAGAAGAETLMRGGLGTRFGFEFFGNQNVQTHTKGTCDDTALQIDGAGAVAGLSVIPSIEAVDAGVAGTLVAGDSFVIAGSTQRYVVTATATAAANKFANVAIAPPLVKAYADHDAITVSLQTGTRSVAFHRNAFALATAPLTEMGNGLGARISTIVDEDTNLALRSRVWYNGDTSSVKAGLDILYGVKTLRTDLASNFRDA